MTNKEYLDYHSVMLKRMSDIVAKKNADYSGNEGDAFANFKQVEKLDIASAEQGFLTRMADKISRISTFVKKGTLSVIDESVEDTLLDLANYALLMSGYIKSKKLENFAEKEEDKILKFRYKVDFSRCPKEITYRKEKIEIKDSSIEFNSPIALSKNGVLEVLKGTDESLITYIGGDLKF
jgi:hypothetical protein